MARTTDSTSEKLATFRQDGVLKLPQAISTRDISTLKDHFWHHVEQDFGIHEHDAATWFANSHKPTGDSRGRRLSAMNPIMTSLRDSKRFTAAEAVVQQSFDAIFGPDRWEPIAKWYSLLSFPGDEATWNVPHTSWHNDEPIAVGAQEPWSVFAFVFLDRVERHTGPTLVVTGSHRRGEAIAHECGVTDERQVRAFDYGLTPDPGKVRFLPVGQLLPELTDTDEWFKRLLATEDTVDRERIFIDEGTQHGDIKSHVVDLTGDPGDVILFDPRCLHTFSANISKRPRQILRVDFRRTR